MQLVLDSSGQYLVVGLGLEGSVVRGVALPAASSEARDLLSVVQCLLHQAGTNADVITQIGCGVGPGSFIGTRAAVCFANGFAAARGVPVHALPSLQACAAGQQQPCLVLRDARRSEAYICLGPDGPTELAALAQMPALLEGVAARTAVAEMPLGDDKRGAGWTAAVEHACAQAALSLEWQAHVPALGLLRLLDRTQPAEYAEPIYLRGFL